MEPSFSVSMVQAGGGVGDNFLAHFDPLSTTWVLLLNMSLPLWPVIHLLMAISSRIMHKATKLLSSQTGYLNMTMSSLSSNGLQSLHLNAIEHLWDVVEVSHHICAANKSAATGWCYHVNTDQNLWGMFPAPCWKSAMNVAVKAEGCPTFY